MRALGDINQVKAGLLLCGYRSVADWARAHEYLPVTVRRTIYDWGHRMDRDPHGGIGRQIMRDLRQTLSCKCRKAA